jgi:DNA-binding response OmpR family regulator
MTIKVLIIEDEESILELLKINMVRRNYEVFLAHDGNEGINIAKKEIPNIILLDLRLPDIDGWEVCSQLRQNPLTRDIKIVILSAATQKTDIDRAQACGAHVFLPKPFDIPKLISTIQALIK